jgi:hypothetical protein
MGRLDSLAQMNLGPWVCMHGFLENYRDGYSHRVGDHFSSQQCAEVFDDTLHRKRKPVEGHLYSLVKYEPVGPNGMWILTDLYGVIYHGPLYSDEELLRMNGLWRVKGYYGVREFYHADETDMQSSLPDARNTLFWSPSVVTDENGEATVFFYCSDLNTAFTGRIEGTDGTGLFGMSEFDFRVIKVPAVGKEGK